MKLLRPILAWSISLSLVLLSPGAEGARVLAQTFSAPRAASTASPAAGFSAAATALPPGAELPALAPALSELSLGSLSAPALREAPAAADAALPVAAALDPAVSPLSASPAAAALPARDEGVRARFEDGTGTAPGQEAPERPGAFRDLSLPDTSTRDLSPDAAGAQSGRNFAAHVGERWGAYAASDVPVPAGAGVFAAPAGLEPAALTAALAGQNKTVFKHFRFLVDADGVAAVIFSRTPVSALSLDFIAELDRLVDALAADRRVKSVVFTGEGGIFLAGADINVLASVNSPAHGARMSANLQRVFDKIEAMDKPVIMAINGHAPGGGLEIAMSGHIRIASTRAKFKLPELELGVLPAAGALQRLPRLVGLTRALEIMLTGETVDAEAAAGIGIVHRVVAPDQLLSEALGEARRLARLEGGEKEAFLRSHRVSRIPVRLTVKERFDILFGGWLIKRRAARTVSAENRENLGSVMKIIDTTVTGVKRGHEAGSRAEAKFFGQLGARPVTKLLTQLVMRRIGGPRVKRFSDASAKPLPVSNVAVVGGGVMGAAIAELAARSDFPVTVKEVDAESLASARRKVSALLRLSGRADSRSAADSERKEALVSGVFEDEEFSRTKPSLLIEAVPENEALKTRLFERWGSQMPPATIFASNTSGAVSITKLAKASGRPGKFVGLHYFNPPDRLPLVELVLPDTEGFTPGQLKELDQTVATVLTYLKKTGRTVVVTRDTPGFAVNRILIAYLDEANRLLEEGVSVEQVDAAMRDFGLPMGPLELADHVGLRLAAELGASFEGSLPSFGKLSGLMPALLKEGLEGKSWGARQGYYNYKPAKGASRANDAAVQAAAGRLGGVRAGAGSLSQAQILRRLLTRMAVEAARVVDEGVVESPLDLDIALHAGMGFPKATGGLLRYADDQGLLPGRARFYEPIGKDAQTSLWTRWFKPILRWFTGLSVVLTGLLGGGPRGKGSIEREAAAMMSAGMKKPEAFVPELYRGALPLTAFSRLPLALEPARQARVDAYKTLIGIGLRPRGLSAAAEKAALAPLDNPSPALRALLEELALDPARVREAVLDVDGIDNANDIPASVLQRISDLGLLKLKIPKQYGGMGLDQREYGQILQSFAGMSLAIGTVISAHSTIGSAPLMMFGTDAQKEKYLKMFAQGKALAAFGLTEPLAGTDLNKLETTAVLSPDGKSWRLTGEKLFITGVDDAGLMYIVSGRTVVNGLELGPSVFIAELPFLVNETWEAKKAKFLELEKRGMRITPFAREGMELMVIRGSDQSFIQLRDFEVPVENVLGPRAANVEGREVYPEGKGKVVPLLSLNKGRAGFGPYVSEIAAWFSTRELEWAADRKMFDMYSPREGQGGVQGFMEYPVTKIGRAQIKAAALEAVSERTSALIDANPDLGVAALSAGIKARVTDQTWEIAVDALELGGGHALIKGAPNRLQMAFLDTWVTRIGEGVNPALAQLFHLLGGAGPAREMARLGGMLRFAGRWLVNRVLPFATTDRGTLGWRAAKWIQRRTAQFALRFGLTSLRLGQAELGRRQNTLIRAFNVAMDLFTLASVEDKLARARETLPKEKVLALEGAAAVLRHNIDREMRYIGPDGHPVENLEREVGRAFIALEAAAKGERPDAVEDHLRFLRASADRFYAGLR